MTRAERWALAVAAGAVFAAVSARSAPSDTDLFWHLATARWVVEHGELARVDTFSSTAAGAPLAQQQWLGQLALWAAYATGSWWGIVALRAAGVLAVAGIVLGLCLSRAPRPWVGVLAAAPGLALSRILWVDRPELLGLVAFAGFLVLALAARAGDVRALAALIPLFALWANVHGSFVVGVVLLVALAGEVALFERALRRRFLAGTALAVAATVLNPDLLGAYDGPGWHFANPPRFIEEWAPPDVTTPHGALFALTLFATLAVALLGSGGSTRWVALLVPLAFLGLSAQRHMPLFALAAAPYLAGAIPDALQRVGVRLAPARDPAKLARLSRAPGAGAPVSGPQLGRDAEPRSFAPALALAMLAAVLLGGALAIAPRQPDLRGFPVGALDALRRERGTLFHEYDWGGFLMWSAPEHAVFVDGRLRPYVGSALDDYVAAMSLRPEWRAVFDRRDIALVLVRPGRPLAVRLREAGWQTLAHDTDLVLLRRPR